MSRRDDDDDRPRSRRRRDDEDDDRPRARRDRYDDDDDDRPRPRRRRDDDDDDYDWDRPRRKKAKGDSPWVVIAVVLVVLFVGCGVGSVFLLLPAVSRVREAAGRTHDSNNLKQIALGVHNYHNVNQSLPPADGDLSWRVHILPYIEQQALYNQFDPNQPWDGPKNRAHAGVVVLTYHTSLDPPSPDTRYRVFVGPGAVFEPGRPAKRFSEFKDGTGNTLLAIEAAETVPWPQPRELPYTPNGPLPAVGHPDRSVVLIVMADGSVRSVDKKRLDPTVLRAIITPSGGEGVRPDW